MNTPLLLKSFSAGYEAGLNIIETLSFSLHQGEAIGISGNNASGKTTLLKGILGQLKYSGGSILYYGEELISKNYYQRMKLTNIGYLPQEYRIFPDLTSKEHLQLNCMTDNYKDILNHILSTDLTRRIYKYISNDLSRNASYLSGGQVTMLSLLCLHLKKHKIIILDEPSDALSHSTLKLVKSQIEQWRNNNKSMLIVDHSKDILDCCDRIIII